MYADDSAVMYLYDTKFITSIASAQTANMLLFAHYYYPIVIESAQTIGNQSLNISYKGTGQNYQILAHSTNVSCLQFAYDESENIPHLAKTCIYGELPCLKSINGNDVNITSLSSTNCNGDFLTFYNASLTNLPSSNCSNTTIKGDNITMNNASLTNLSGCTCSFTTCKGRNGSVSKVSASDCNFTSNIATESFLFGSASSTNSFKLVPYRTHYAFNPSVVTGDNLIVYGCYKSTIDQNQILNIVPHSSTASGLRMNGSYNTFTGNVSIMNTLYSSNIIANLIKKLYNWF